MFLENCRYILTFQRKICKKKDVCNSGLKKNRVGIRRKLHLQVRRKCKTPEERAGGWEGEDAAPQAPGKAHEQQGLAAPACSSARSAGHRFSDETDTCLRTLKYTWF